MPSVSIVTTLDRACSLYQKPGETEWTIDLSKMKHKTIRFCN